MGMLLWIVVIFLALDTASIGGLLAWRLILAPTTTSVLDFGPLLIAAGVLTALVTFLVNLRRARSDDVLKAATDLLEKAYKKLAPENGSTEPKNYRFAWLSAARLVATAERLGKEITENSHCRIYQEIREYWRQQLYELIFPSIPEGLPSSFYAEKPEHMISRSSGVRAPLSEKSLAFLYRFIRWPENVRDPIGEEPVFTDEEIEKMLSFGPRGLGNLLSEVRRLKHSGTSR